MEYKPSYSDSLRADILPSYTDSLMHHGILGMKWGVRRYQNEDGSLTPEGKKRYQFGDFTRKTVGGFLAKAASNYEMKQYEKAQEAKIQQAKSSASSAQNRRDTDTWDDIIDRPSNESSKYEDLANDAADAYYECYDKYGPNSPKTDAAYDRASDLSYKYGYDTGKKAAKKFSKEYDSDTLNRVIDKSLEEYFSTKEIKEMGSDPVEKFAVWNGTYEQYHF